MRAGQASSTARLIAAAYVIAARESSLHHLVDAEAAELSGRLLDVGGGRWLSLAARMWVGRRALRWLERKSLPGLLSHWLHRKRAIAQLVEEARAEGFSQLLVVGAGLDTLPLRMAGEGSRGGALPRMERIVCVDHPATQAMVREAMPELGRDGGVLRLLAVDLASRPLGEELQRSGLLLRVPTVVVAEGLLMYLTPERVHSLLQDFAQLEVPRVRVIVTAMDTATGEPVSFRPRSARADRWLKRKAEPMRSSIPAGKERDLFGAAGLRHVRTLTAQEFRGAWREGELEGENIIVAER